MTKSPAAHLAVPPLEQRCTRIKRNGERCRKWAVNGTTVCYRHGANLPAVRDAANRRLAAQRATEDMEEFGVSIETTPPEALEEMLYEAAGNVAMLRDQVNELDCLTEVVHSSAGARTVPHPLVEMYDAERDRLQRFAKDYAILGLAERKQALFEAEVDQFYQVVRRALNVLPADQRAAVEDEMKRQLQRLVAIEATAS